MVTLLGPRMPLFFGHEGCGSPSFKRGGGKGNDSRRLPGLHFPILVLERDIPDSKGGRPQTHASFMVRPRARPLRCLKRGMGKRGGPRRAGTRYKGSSERAQDLTTRAVIQDEAQKATSIRGMKGWMKNSNERIASRRHNAGLVRSVVCDLRNTDNSYWGNKRERREKTHDHDSLF